MTKAQKLLQATKRLVGLLPILKVVLLLRYSGEHPIILILKRVWLMAQEQGGLET